MGNFIRLRNVCSNMIDGSPSMMKFFHIFWHVPCVVYETVTSNKFFHLWVNPKIQCTSKFTLETAPTADISYVHYHFYLQDVSFLQSSKIQATNKYDGYNPSCHQESVQRPCGCPVAVNVKEITLVHFKPLTF